MPVPRVRFTVRRMMVAVAIVAGWRDARRMEYGFRALDHAVRERAFATGSSGCFTLACAINPRKAAYHADLARKYEWAAEYPWLPVPPDPPEPE